MISLRWIIYQDLRKTISNAAILAVNLPPGWRRYVIVRKSCL
ncbi:hypothetical protein [Kamptonema sp. UHCC 0994]|nr:hypothetical protein [Kamptonema sp. UHCC 0994]